MSGIDFVIGGATRSATRVLSGILNAHPNIYMPEFNPKSKKRKTPMSYFDMTAQKDQKEGQKTLYGEWEDVAEDCARYYPKAKIIFNLRDPVTRAYSQYCKSRRDGKEVAVTFEEAIEEEMEGIRRPETTGRCWIYKSQYQIHLDEWFSYFPREQILILIMEEWVDNPAVGLAPLEAFLDLEKGSLLKNARNPSVQSGQKAGLLTSLLDKLPIGLNTGNVPMQPSTKEELEDIFSVDKLYVANVLGRDKIEVWR
ncbi:MAG: sulfotransferase [Alphaproteobacteria bacterium]|nr:sulfotransferase [Alphaproteobacteria bacterium]